MKELPKRKRIRLQNYDYSSNGLYFVTICTEDKKSILSTIVGDDVGIVPYKTGFGNQVVQNNGYKRNWFFNMAKVIL